jgi:hypothetical protein
MIEGAARKERLLVPSFQSKAGSKAEGATVHRTVAPLESQYKGGEMLAADSGKSLGASRWLKALDAGD